MFLVNLETLIELSNFGLELVHVDCSAPSTPVLKIHTLEGVMTAIEGDFIIKGVKGEFYPCKPDIFEQTYEQVV
jgi:mRNA degradation ribonuclease J1/J2